MFKIEYQVTTQSFDKVEFLTEDELRYDFLLGSVRFIGDNNFIDMAWDWIPLLDLSICLAEIVFRITSEEIINELYEFTESEETLEFLRDRSEITIIPSFSLNVVIVKLDEFNMEVESFQNSINKYIIEKVGSKNANNILKKYFMF